VALLDAATRAKLPDRAFAYIDAQGHRRLPIHDEAHVRNALARFGQVRFESDAAREQARARLLKAAKKYRIVPVGFIAGQLHTERELARRHAHAPVVLPDGFLTMVMTDVEGSTDLVHRLGDAYRELLESVRSILAGCIAAHGGHLVDARADESFAVFENPVSALQMAVDAQRDLRSRTWSGDVQCRVRIGIHSGYPTLADGNYLGVPVHTAARVSAAAHGGQVVVSGDTRTAVRGSKLEGVRFRALGSYRLRGLPEPVPLFQIAAKGLDTRFPDLRGARPVEVS
jgi:class 3 adenylate cyclase